MPKRAFLLVLLSLFASLAGANPTKLVSAAREQTLRPAVYDGSYARIAYPMGDVPADRGVCTDVIVRAYRAIGIDLQVLVHEDMKAHFPLYPRIWGLSRPDPNIDHRRVPNLQKFLERAGARVPSTNAAADFRPGDVVTWMLPGNLPHIGIVSDRRAPATGRPLIIHNIGAGPREEDMLFAYPVTGHYRYRLEMAAPENAHAIALLATLSQGCDFSVGCYCEDEARCHRSVLRELLAAAGARIRRNGS